MCRPRAPCGPPPPQPTAEGEGKVVREVREGKEGPAEQGHAVVTGHWASPPAEGKGSWKEQGEVARGQCAPPASPSGIDPLAAPLWHGLGVCGLAEQTFPTLPSSRSDDLQRRASSLKVQRVAVGSACACTFPDRRGRGRIRTAPDGMQPAVHANAPGVTAAKVPGSRWPAPSVWRHA